MIYYIKQHIHSANFIVNKLIGHLFYIEIKELLSKVDDSELCK